MSSLGISVFYRLFNRIPRVSFIQDPSLFVLKAIEMRKDEKLKVSIDLSSSIDENDANINLESSPPWKSISFAIGGWLQFYLYGVARAIQARGLDSSDVVYCGASAGALAAVGLVLDGDFDAAIEFCKQECVPKAHGHISGLFRCVIHNRTSSTICRFRSF